MADQQRNGAHDKKKNWKSLNFVGIFVPRGCFCVPKASKSSTSGFSTVKRDPLIPTRIPSNWYNPLDVAAIRKFADKNICWVSRAWESARNALPKHRVSPHNELVEPTISLKESSLKVKCCYHNKLEMSAPLDRHILVYLLKKYPVKGYALLDAENSLECNLGSSTHDSGDFNDACASSFAGIFLQANIKEGANLAHRLVDGGWARERHHGLAFARLQGEPGMICASSSQPQVNFDKVLLMQHYKSSTPSLLTSLQRLSLRSFKDQILHVVPHQEQQDCPDKEMLDSVQDFFLYTELEGRRVFEELDRDADGKLTMDDVKVAMKKMKLPVGYAQDFMRSKHSLWPAKYFGWSDFSSLIQEKEPVIVQLFNSLGVSKSGTVKSLHVKDSLVRVGLCATEANVTAMMKFLAEGAGDGLKYGQFRRFMLLLPTEQLSRDPWSVWLKAATNGIEPSSEDLQFSMLKYISSVPRNFSHHLEMVK